MLISQTKNRRPFVLLVLNVSAVFLLLACTASCMDVPWKAVCVRANYEYTYSLATSCTWEEAAAAASPSLGTKFSNLQQRTYSCLHCTFLQMQTPVLSAILLLFPRVCMVALKAEVASVRQPVSCASDPEHAFAPVLPGISPCPSRIKKG